MYSQLKKITKTILITTFLVLPAIAFSQKLNKPSIDKFSNDTIHSTSQEKIGSKDSFTSTSAEYLNAYLVKINSHVYLKLELDLTIDDHKYFVVDTGKKAFFKLVNNTVLSLANVKPVEATQQTIKNGFVQRDYLTTVMLYPISNGDIQKILASAVTTIRVEMDDQYVDFDIKPKNSDMLKKMFTLIISAK